MLVVVDKMKTPCNAEMATPNVQELQPPFTGIRKLLSRLKHAYECLPFTTSFNNQFLIIVFVCLLIVASRLTSSGAQKRVTRIGTDSIVVRFINDHKYPPDITRFRHT